VKINLKFCQTSWQPKKRYYKTQHTTEERDMREREREREESLLELRFGREREESFLELRFERERKRRVFKS
jgi:hypothetical protein